MHPLRALVVGVAEEWTSFDRITLELKDGRLVGLRSPSGRLYLSDRPTSP